MKKLIIVPVLILMMSFFLSSCSNSSNETSEPETDKASNIYGVHDRRTVHRYDPPSEIEPQISNDSNNSNENI